MECAASDSVSDLQTSREVETAAVPLKTPEKSPGGGKSPPATGYSFVELLMSQASEVQAQRYHKESRY